MTSLASPTRCMAQITMYIRSTSHQRCQFEALAGSMWWLLCQPSPLVNSATSQLLRLSFAGFVVAIAEDVGHRVDRPGDVPDADRSQQHAPDEQAQAKLQSGQPIAAGQPRGNHSGDEIERGMSQINPHRQQRPLQTHVERIAQHVAGKPLVGRGRADVAVLDKQPAHVAPEEAGPGRVRIGMSRPSRCDAGGGSPPSCPARLPNSRWRWSPTPVPTRAGI